MSDPWWSKGLRFECQGSGNCCVSHGDFGYVYLTREDRINIARKLGITTSAFTRTQCKKTDGIYHLADSKGPCRFLKDKKCSIYKARPMQCRTWPFWPEVMPNQKEWDKEVKSFCPGIGKGKLWNKEEIKKQRALQEEWEEALGE